MRGVGRFFGRELALRSLTTGVMQGRSFAVCGGPKTGRTSALLQIADRFRELWVRQPAAVKIAPAYLDCQDVDGEGLSHILAAVWDALVDAVSDPRVRGQVAPPAVPQPDFHRPGCHWCSLWHESYGEFQQLLAGSSAWCEQVVLLDNFDLPIEADPDEASRLLEELAHPGSSSGPMAVVAGGGRRLRDLLLDHNALARCMRPIFLGVLRESEAASLMRTDVPALGPELRAPLLRQSGRHPYALQRLLGALEAQGEQGGDIDAAVEESYPDLQRLFHAMWHELDLDRRLATRGAYAAPEHAVMQLLLDCGEGVDIRTAERELKLSPLREYFELLEYMGAAERVLRGDMPVWQSNFDLWNAWYSERIYV